MIIIYLYLQNKIFIKSNQPTKLILTKNNTKHAMKNYPNFLRFFLSDFLNSSNKTMTPKGANIPVKNAFLGKSSPTMSLQKY